MKDHVTVIPSDQLIIVDGESLQCEFTAHITNLHAIQWHNGKGGIEINDDGAMSNLTITSYDKDVAPYVKIWEEKKAEQEADPEPPTAEQLIKQLEKAVEEWLDSVVKERGYRSVEACVSYINSDNETYKAEATAVSAWRDAVWAKAHEIINTVTDDNYPESEDLIAQLPTLDW